MLTPSGSDALDMRMIANMAITVDKQRKKLIASFCRVLILALRRMIRGMLTTFPRAISVKRSDFKTLEKLTQYIGQHVQRVD